MTRRRTSCSTCSSATTSTTTTTSGSSQGVFESVTDEAVTKSRAMDQQMLQRHTSMILREKSVIARHSEAEKKKLLRRSKSLQTTALGGKRTERYHQDLDKVEETVPVQRLYVEEDFSAAILATQEEEEEKEEKPPPSPLMRFKTDDMSADLKQIALKYAETKPVVKEEKSEELGRSKRRDEVKAEWEQKSDKLLQDQMPVWRDKFNESYTRRASPRKVSLPRSPNLQRCQSMKPRSDISSPHGSLERSHTLSPNVFMKRSQSMTPTMVRRVTGGRSSSITPTMVRRVNIGKERTTFPREDMRSSQDTKGSSQNEFDLIDS